MGAFYQDQKNHILQDYLVEGLATSLSVPGWRDTLWLTNQLREDKDYAIFGEANWDIFPHVTLTAGTRYYKFDNTIIGFNGFGPDNPSGSSLGYNRCLTTGGKELRDPDDDNPLIGGGVADTPCTNVGVVVNGKLQPKRVKGNGWLYRFNAQWKPTDAIMLYATWSKGFRPGGINRQPTAPAYGPDFLVNYEAGWKTTFLGTAYVGMAPSIIRDGKASNSAFWGKTALPLTKTGAMQTRTGSKATSTMLPADSRSLPRPPTPMRKPRETSVTPRSSPIQLRIAAASIQRVMTITSLCHRARGCR